MSILPDPNLWDLDDLQRSVQGQGPAVQRPEGV